MDYEAVRTWATVFAAVGTVGAVLLALYRDVIRDARRRPRLDLKFDPSPGDQVFVRTAEGRDVAYVRLRVLNEEGKDTADEVQVLVTEVQPSNGSSQVTPIGLPLTWTGSLPPVTVAPVHPGAKRHIDLLHVDWPPAADELDVANKYFEAVECQLDVYPNPIGDQHRLAAGKYEIRLDVLSRNANAARYAIAVEWDGTWHGKEQLWQTLRVQPPSKVE